MDFNQNYLQPSVSDVIRTSKPFDIIYAMMTSVLYCFYSTPTLTDPFAAIPKCSNIGIWCFGGDITGWW